MKIKYEYEVVTSKNYYTKLDDMKREGWEVYKTEIKIEKTKTLCFSSSTEIIVWHIRRDITPVKIKINTTINIPKYCYDSKNVNGFVLWRGLEDYIRMRGLLK